MMRGDPATHPELGMGAKFRKLREGQYYLSPKSRADWAWSSGSDQDLIDLIDDEGEWL